MWWYIKMHEIYCKWTGLTQIRQKLQQVDCVVEVHDARISSLYLCNNLLLSLWCITRSTPPSQPNNIRGGNIRLSVGTSFCPSIWPSVRLSTKSLSGLPLSDVAAVTKPRHETRWNLLGWPKLMNRSQPLVGQSSPYCEDVWGRYCCLTSFFPIVDTCLRA